MYLYFIKQTQKLKIMKAQTIKLSEITKGTLLYVLANAKININGIYTCTYKGVKTIIIK